MENLEIYNKVRNVPQEALKPIIGGRLKGKSDINPVWRIKMLTETFGICGFGWKYEITKQWTETCANEIKAFCNINLYIKMDGEWSEAIPGTGGSSFATSEQKGVYVDDEAYKMALTDALSVSMKALGVAADVYFEKGANLETKYSNKGNVIVPKPAIDPNLQDIIYNISNTNSVDGLQEIWNECSSYQVNPIFKSAITNRKNELER